MRIKENIAVSAKYIQLSFKIALQYKFDRFFLLFAVLVREIGNVLVIILLLQRFIEIKGWTLEELLFLYSFLYISYGIFVLFFTGLRDFEDLVYDGEFDRYLLRPQSLMYQILLSKIDIPAAFGYCILGIFLFITTSNGVQISWTLPNIIYYTVMLISSIIIQMSIFLFASALSFKAIKVANVRNLIFFSIRKCAAYPLSFYPCFISSLLIYIIPFAFVNYFPALFFLEKQESLQYNSVYFYISPFIGAVMLSLSLLSWNKLKSKYSSSGNQL